MPAYVPTRICVYAGSKLGNDPRYADVARALAREIVARGFEVVYGGGKVGLMGVVADTALAEGGRVVGIIPSGLARKEVAHGALSEQHIVESMHERKAKMAELADAFVALPGGYGTFEELIEVLTWAQLGIHFKPCGLLNVAGYYDGLLAMLDHAEATGLLLPEYRRLLLVNDDPAALLDQFRTYRSPIRERWLDRTKT